MHIQFAELPVFDQDRAIAFYVDKLGCEVAADAPTGADGWRWVEVKFPGARTALHVLRRPDDKLSAEPVLVLVEADVQRSDWMNSEPIGPRMRPAGRQSMVARSQATPPPHEARTISALISRPLARQFSRPSQRTPPPRTV